MPIYEYQCQSCGHQMEAIQSFSDAPLTKCPACHHKKLKKLISAPSFHLKGTGWYATDFKDSNKKPKTEKNDSGTTDTSETKTTDTPSKDSKKTTSTE